MFFDLADMFSVCLSDASVLPTAVSGVILIPALSVTVRGNIPGTVPAGIRRRHGGIDDPFSRIGKHHPVATSAVKHAGRSENGIFNL
jgi:hypothetical protein